jgi:hypothetical protein
MGRRGGGGGRTHGREERRVREYIKQGLKASKRGIARREEGLM